MSDQGNNTAKSGGIGIAGILGIVFIVLKLTGYIDWSWWWVTIPFWGIPAVLVVVAVIACLWIGITAVIKSAIKKRKQRRRGKSE